MAARLGIRWGQAQVHIALSVGFLLLAMAGWGAYATRVLSQRDAEADLQRQVSRLTAERTRLLADKSQPPPPGRESSPEAIRAHSELSGTKAELTAARAAIARLIQSLEQGRSEVSAAQGELAALRLQLEAERARAQRNGNR